MPAALFGIIVPVPESLLAILADSTGLPLGGRVHFFGGAIVAIASSTNCFVSTGLGASVMRSVPLCVLGNAITSRMLCRFSMSITMRSRPRAIPPCGGAPKRRASRRNANFFCASSGLIPSKPKILDCRAGWWIRMDPPPSSMPLSTMS